jgi:hypothetical protein
MRMPMTEPTEPPISYPNADAAKTYRQLRLVRALFQLDDPELERALAVIIDRLAKARPPSDGPVRISEESHLESPHE